MKSFNNGLDNLATATNSWLVLYKPTVVIYTWGSLINESYSTEPSDPEINDGFVE